MKRLVLILIILILALALVLILCLDRLITGDLTQPVTTEATPGTIPSTETIYTQEPTEETLAPTSLPDPDNEYIGSLYTRMELEALDNTNLGYGPGTASGGNRPPYAQAEQSKYGEFGGNFIGKDEKTAYLTFDCGYEFENLTARILDTLREKHVKAVFFVTMSYAMKNPALVQRMIDEGHTLGNHSASHRILPELTLDEAVREIMDLHQYILEHFGYKMTLFRPPEGAFSQRMLALTQSLGYKTVHWSFAYADWDTDNQPDPNTALKKVTSSHHNGAIYLLHAVSATNAEILPQIIDFLQDRGYELQIFA